MPEIARRHALAAALASPGVARASYAQQTFATATGTTGGVSYPLGGGLTNLLSRQVGGLSATIEVTGG